MSDCWFTGPVDAHWTLMLAHGAGQGSDSDFMVDMARQLAAAGLRVAQFDFPYMQRMHQEGKRRPPDRMPILCDAYTAAIDTVLRTGISRERLLIGGKSMGGRVASLIAEAQHVAGLVCLGYPFHPPGKPDKLRTEHLLNLHTPTLICQGERDTFGAMAEVLAYPLSNTIQLAWLNDGDHSFKPRRRSGMTEAQNRQQAVRFIVDFVARLPS